MRLIDADALMELLTTAIRNMQGMARFIGAEDDPEIQMEIKAYTDIANGVKDAPTIEPERKIGHWIEANDSYNRISGRCSVCGWESHLYEDDVVGMNFCPNCGTDMRGEKNEID